MESKKHKKALYLEHLEKQKKSGISVAKYCQLYWFQFETLVKKI